MTGIAAVQARIAELQALFTPTVATTTTAATTGSATASTSSGVDFAQALSALTGTGTTGTTVADSAVSGTVTGESLVESAKKYQGTPYVWGGESLDEGGLDCSGLVQRSLADLGVTDIPRTAREQMTLGEEVPSLDQARPGDLVVFNGGTHIGIYVGDGKMIDAPKPGDQVRIRDVYTEPSTIRRILPSAAEVTASTASASASAGQTALAVLAGSGSTSSSSLTSLLSVLNGSSTTGSSTTSDLSALLGVTA
ncbi:C40 family peptidase [Cellulomonas sp. RIT-PI-Y]|uniref:C40 family peptidase n=1 Tax=Cellulomonas sp. RIT-PI-Y TaxID=3035297 RepID=UPI0021D8D034|nr:C40 family peptidase [Cellulomonas sp. RIT-PI-Y]